MKLPLKLSRCRSSSLPSSTPPSPSGSSSPSPSPTTPSPKKLLSNLRVPFPSLGKCPSSRRHEPSSEIVEMSSPSPLESGRRNGNPRSSSNGKAMGSSSPSSSMRKDKAMESSLMSPQSIPSIVMREIEEVFGQFDANGDGKISADELREVLRSLGEETSKEEAVLMVREVDADGDGFIDLEEFVSLNTRGLHVTGEMASQEELTAAFEVFDLDKNGWITAEELAAVMNRLGKAAAKSCSLEDCRRMISGVDRKGLGQVDFDDFKLMMSSNAFLRA